MELRALDAGWPVPGVRGVAGRKGVESNFRAPKVLSTAQTRLVTHWIAHHAFSSY